MEPRTDLSWRVGERALPVYLPITCRGLRILAVHARMVLGHRGTCSDLRTRVPLVALVLRLAFTRVSPRRAVFPGCSKCFARLFCSPSQVLLWPLQVTQRDSAASFNSTVGAPYRTAAFRPHFLEIHSGMLGFARLLMAVEDHGAGNQFVRVRLWPKCSLLELLLPVLSVSLSVAAALDNAWVAAA